ncbi:MAG TPA: NEW3 domain-containing protein [Solirubrobacterales bacterium]|nr:NEW3 domain-containing protein [Solirubrobacterales bacterium]
MTPETHKPLWKRVRRVVALGAATVAALAVSGVAAGAAQAQSLELEFDEVVANIGASFQESELVGPGDDPVTMSGDINLATGDFVIPPDGVFFPEQTFTDAPLPTIDTTVSWVIDQPVTGNYDTTTGDLSASFVADIVIDLTSGGNPVAQCVMSDVALPLETTGSLPGDPDDYDAAPFAPPTRAGAVVDLWDDLPPAEGASPLCAQVTGAVGGPGGIWMSGDAGIGFHVEFNRGIRQLGASAPVVFEDDENPIVFDGDFDPATGAVTIPTDGVFFPPVVLTEPFDITIETEAEEVTTGTFDPDTGELTLNMVVTSTTSALGAVCAFEGFEWNLSTSNTEPFQGIPFVNGLSGEGAIVAGWEDIPPVTTISGPPQSCTAIRNAGMGPGGVIYERAFGPPPAANLAISVKPKRKAVKQGKKRVFRATVRNTGNAPATGVRVCINAPKKLKVPGGKCRQIGVLADGTSALRKFTVKAKRKTKPKAYKLRFRATSPDAAAAVTRATLRVKKR